MADYNLAFDAYRVYPEALPNVPAIYLLLKTIDTYEGDPITEVVYIGKAENLYDRFEYPNQHEKYMKAVKECDDAKGHSYISISYARCPKNDLERIEACLIYVNKPRHNTDNIKTFNESETIVRVYGKYKSTLKHINIAKKD